ncbi:MAG: hypothetical protein Q9195_005478 [Heterodermia aff. obscurata]
MGIQSGGPVEDVDADYIQTAAIQKSRHFAPDLQGYQYNFLPIDDGSWKRVKIEMNWLSNLTPLLGNSTSGAIVNWADVTSILKTVVATMIADGMSRQGYAANEDSSIHFTDALSLLPWDNSASSRESLLTGTYKFPPPAGVTTPLKWSVVVGGYAYRADSVAYYLALTVLFLHAALALCHMVYMLRKRVYCDEFDSFIGLIVLAAKSGMPVHPGAVDVFENASSGIDRYRTMGTKVRVRAKATSAGKVGSHEDVKILFGSERLGAGYQALKSNEVYE